MSQAEGTVVQGSRDLQNAIRSSQDLSSAAPAPEAGATESTPDVAPERSDVPASDRSVKDVLNWKPDPTVNAKVDDAISSIRQFEAMWANFQKRFDDMNKAILGSVAASMGQGGLLAGGEEVRDTKEYNAPYDKVEAQARRLAGFIREAKCVMVLTGAGVSTSAGICDYRGPQGQWTLKGKGIKKDITPVDTLAPTVGHMAISTLVAEGVVQHVVSTNVDGLHRLSGVPADKLTEVHGNCFVERCNECDVAIERPFPVRYKIGRKDKATGGACPKCGARMVDSVVNFGDKLRADEWQRVNEMAREKCDLLIVLGTSIRVMPSAGLPQTVHSRDGKVCIINKQRTGSDNLAHCKCHTSTDLFMMLVLAELGIHFRPFPKPRRIYTYEEKYEWRGKEGCRYQDATDYECEDDEEVEGAKRAAELAAAEAKDADGEDAGKGDAVPAADTPAPKKPSGKPAPKSSATAKDKGSWPRVRVPQGPGTGAQRTPPKTPPKVGQRTSRVRSEASTGSRQPATKRSSSVRSGGGTVRSRATSSTARKRSSGAK